ncbi:MAG: sugar phosphate isomerase/epimerase family protein [Meiothermus sp.]|nr:sugar phosphate isomerase/epimerase family protein [Meiothermus sp.]
MKLGVHLGYFMDSWGDDPLPLIPRAKRAGCEVVEISLYSRLPDRLETLRRVADAEGVELTFTTGLQPQKDISSADPAVFRAGLDYLQECLERVAEAGGSVLSGVVFAPWGVRTGEDLEGRLARATEGLAQAARHAERLGVDLGIEPINRYETDLVTTVGTAMQMVRSIGSPRVGVLFDVFHVQLEEDSIAGAAAEAGPALKHVHLADNHRGLPGSGSLDWGGLLSALESTRYPGRAVIEAFTRTGTAVARDTGTWVPRGRTGDLDADLRDSLQFLRGLGW